MDKVCKVQLVGKTHTKDSLGQYIATETTKDVIARVASVTRTEFFQGSQGGYSPEHRITIHRNEYSGEDEVVFDGKHYAIYRTYEALNNKLELYLERKVEQ